VFNGTFRIFDQQMRQNQHWQLFHFFMS